jgi:glycosyltransferase involved in cell wall biosynthesis
MKNLSIIIPVYNEEDGIEYLLEQINQTDITKYFDKHEIVIIDDGSKDGSLSKLNELRDKLKMNNIKIISYKQNKGLSFALKKGIEHAKYDYVLYCDSDMQVNLSQLNKVTPFVSQDFALISGVRKKRKEQNFAKIVISKVANSVRASLLNDNCKDTGCPFKFIRRDVAVKLPLEFKGAHRFIPYFIKEMGEKVKFVEVEHNKRFYGKSKFNLSNRFFGPIFDLFVINYIMKKRTNNIKAEVI